MINLILGFSILLASIIIFGLSIVAHEFGHILGLYASGCKIEFKRKGINIGVSSPDLEKLDAGSKMAIAMLGIITGWLPIIFFTFNYGWPFTIYSLMYFAGCSKDVALVVKLWWFK